MKNKKLMEAAENFKLETETTEPKECFINGAKWADKNKWINVDDDLPKENKLVLVRALMNGKKITEINARINPVGRGSLVDKNGFVNYGLSGFKVIGWRYINEPRENN